MSLTTSTYTTNGGPHTTATSQPSHHKLTGTAHRGPAWTNAVQVLRAAVNNAVAHASAHRRIPDANDLGVAVLDHVLELDPKALHVLAVTLGTLVRSSQRNHQ
jgi:hypothetical protein